MVLGVAVGAIALNDVAVLIPVAGAIEEDVALAAAVALLGVREGGGVECAHAVLLAVGVVERLLRSRPERPYPAELSIPAGGTGSETDWFAVVSALTVAELLRAARGDRSLRSVAKAANLSPASLSRYEAGRVPRGVNAAALDRALGLDGALVTLAALQTSGVGLGPPAARWEHFFEAKWEGQVWIEVLPVRPGPHEVTLRWGPWGHSMTLEIQSSGVVLVTGKSSSEAVAPMTVDVAPPATLRFGVGDASKFPNAQPIYHGWEPIESSNLMRTAGALLADALKFCGRTPTELATFLDVPLSTVEAFLSGLPISLSRIPPRSSD